MSISKQIYKGTLHFKEIVSSKLFSIFFFGFLSSLLLFGTMNVYAQSGEQLIIKPAWEETKKFHNRASETEDDEDNMNSRLGTEFMNSSWAVLSLMAPEFTPLESARTDDLPYDLQKGVLGMIKDTGSSVYAMYPKVMIGEHLAQEWVPGYKDTATSLYAAESGYQELQSSGIVSLWTKSLNIAYVVFVLVMLIAGFMIMFRHKLGGQTMVTLGTVLSKVIISLILATFSFAIAGLIIDIGGLLVALIAIIMDNQTTPISNIMDIMRTVLGTKDGVWGADVIGGVIQSFNFVDLFLKPFMTGDPLGLTSVSTNAFSFVGKTILNSTVFGPINILIIIIVLGIIFFGAIKVLWTLFKAYFSLLIAVVLGPLQITLGAIPGNTNAVKNWLFTVTRNVLVFPVVFFVLNLPNYIANSGGSVILKFPEKLVLEQTGDLAGVSAGGVFTAILRIFVLYFAAQAPKFLEGVFPTATSKEVGESMIAVKGSLAKVPFVGSMFK